LGRVGRLCFLGAGGLIGSIMPILSVLAIAAEPQVQFDPHIVRLPVLDGKGLPFTRLSPADGLSHTSVSQIVQDDQGFLWFGGVYGLNRYDGYKFKVFVHDARQPNSIGGNRIRALFKDRSGMLWVASNRFLDKLDPATEKFTHYQVDSDDPAGTVVHISQDRAGMLWLISGTGLHRLDPTTGQIRHYRSGLSSHDVQWTGEDSSGTFWVGTSEGLDAFDREAGKVTLHIPIGRASQPAFYEDGSGTFWIYNQTGNGLATFDKKTNRVVQYSFYPRDPPTGGYTGVSSIQEDRHGNLWIGSPALGVLRMDPQRRCLVRYRHDPADPNSVAEDHVVALTKDREGNIWVGLHGHGPNHFSVDPTLFETFRSGPGANDLTLDWVNAIYADRKGTLWIGNDDGLNRIDRKSGRLERWAAGIKTQPMLTSIIEDAPGYLWAGTWGHGVIRFDRRAGFRIFQHADGDRSSLSSDRVTRLFIDHARTLWVSTDDGLNRFDSRTGKFTVFKVDWNKSLSQYYMTIAEDPTRNVLWLGSSFTGLHRFDLATGQIQIYRSNSANLHALPDDGLPVVFVSGSGVVWAGNENGLHKFDPTSGTVTSYDQKAGLAGNVVGCILEDEHGALWVSTNGGLSRFDPKTRNFINYSAADGLPGNDLTGRDACFKSPTGEMFFGGFSGGVAFYPDKVVTPPYIPPVTLTEFRLSGIPVEVGGRSPLSKTISHTTRLRLSHEQNTFSLGFSALSYRNPATNRYRYKLEPLENTWREVGSDERLATYTTLPAGVYTFRVQAATSRGAWSEPGVRLEMEILPALWKTAWFEAVCGVLVLALVVGLYRLRLYQLVREFHAQLEGRVDERTRVARELHDTLLQSFQALMFHFQAVNDVLPPGKGKEALEKVLDRADQAIVEGRNAIQNIRSSTTVTNELSHSVSALGEELAGSIDGHNRPPTFRVSVEGTPREIHPILRDDIYRIAGEALRNAFRHAQANQIEAEIAYGERLLRLRIRDDGKGIDPKHLNTGRDGHWGLPGMRERAQEIGAQLEIWSESEAGTEVELRIPGPIAYERANRRRGLQLFHKARGGANER
jgi:ligand-binding sensor domain-containing protein/signal transduction histidine kinase